MNLINFSIGKILLCSLVLSAFFLISCGKTASKFNYGKTTKSEVIQQMGEPLRAEKIPLDNAEMLIYEGNEKYQIQNNILTYGLRDPRSDEKTLLFWRHKLRDCQTSLNQISKPSLHEPPEFELRCASEGVSIIYSEGNELISRIIDYAKE